MSNELSMSKGHFALNADLIGRATRLLQPEQWFETPAPGMNHALWLMGHMVWARALVLGMVGQEWSAPEGFATWSTLFGRGEPRLEAEKYPAPAAIASAWETMSKCFLPALDAAKPDLMDAPASGPAPSFDGKVSGTVAFFSLHETYHVGQLAGLTKWLGYPGITG